MSSGSKAFEGPSKGRVTGPHSPFTCNNIHEAAGHTEATEAGEVKRQPACVEGTQGSQAALRLQGRAPGGFPRDPKDPPEPWPAGGGATSKTTGGPAHPAPTPTGLRNTWALTAAS